MRSVPVPAVAVAGEARARAASKNATAGPGVIPRRVRLGGDAEVADLPRTLIWRTRMICTRRCSSRYTRSAGHAFVQRHPRGPLR
jgi:hypothetical protein